MTAFRLMCDGVHQDCIAEIDEHDLSCACYQGPLCITMTWIDAGGPSAADEIHTEVLQLQAAIAATTAAAFCMQALQEEHVPC